MEKRRPRTAPLVVASVTMLLCGAYNTIFNILRRASRLLGFVRGAAELNTDLTEIPVWKDIAVSVYDIIAIFNLSSGMLAAVQMTAGAVGLIYAALYFYRERATGGAAIPGLIGILTSFLGVLSVFSLYLSRSSGAFLLFTLVLTQVLVPILFTSAAFRFNKEASLMRKAERENVK